MATLFENKASGNTTIDGQSVAVESNKVTAELFDTNSVTLVKSQTNPLVVLGGINSYTIVITNLSLSPITSFNFIDTLPIGMSYKTGTFKVNTVAETPSVIGQDINYLITTLAVGITTITFDVDII